MTPLGLHRPVPWRPEKPHIALAMLLLLTAGTLTGAYLLKAHCDNAPWNGPQYDFWDWPPGTCYSDIVPLYAARNLNDGATPYLDRASGDVAEPTDHPGFLEYPLLTGVVMWLAGRLTNAATFGWTPGTLSFLRWNALLLAPFALGTTWLLWRMTPEPRRVVLFAVGPPLYLYAFHNWDLVAVFFLVFAIERFEAERHLQSGVMLALGASSKLFPLAAAPILFFLLWRRAHGDRPLTPLALWTSLRAAPGAWRLFAGVVGTLVLVHLPLLVAGGGPLYLEVFRFHADRTPNFESIWFAVDHAFLAGDGRAIDDPRPWPTLLLVALYAGASLWAWLRNADARTAAFLALFPLLLTNVFFSVQYVLWLLPSFVLLRMPWWSYLLFLAGDIAVAGTLFPYFGDLTRGAPADFTPAAWAVVFRQLVFIGLAILAVLCAARRGEQAAGALPSAEVGSAERQVG